MLSTILSYILRGVYRVITFKAWWFEKMPDDVSIKDMEITLAPVTLPARIFEYHDSTETKKHPLLLYFHGGGGCLGSVYTTHESCLRVLASELKCTIVGVDYRLAPEFPCPVGANDCTLATKWMKNNLQDFNSNGKLVLAGDSMGGLLSIAVPYAGADVHGSVCLYPNTMYGLEEFESWKTNGGPTSALSKDLMDMLHKMLFGGKTAQTYCEEHKDEGELLAKAFPLTTDEAILKAKMPQTFLVTCKFPDHMHSCYTRNLCSHLYNGDITRFALFFVGERDLLRDEGKAFGTQLKKVGVPVEEHHYDEEHGFMCSNGRGDSFEDCLGKLKLWLDRL